MICWIIQGTHPFHTWFVPLHFANWARTFAALFYSLFRWQTFQLQKDSRRSMIPWYRWPELPFTSFTWRSWTTVRASDSKMTWVSLISLAKMIPFSSVMISVSKLEYWPGKSFHRAAMGAPSLFLIITPTLDSLPSPKTAPSTFTLHTPDGGASHFPASEVCFLLHRAATSL